MATADPSAAERAATRRAQLRTALTFAALAAVFWTAYYFPFDKNGAVPRLYASYLEDYARLTGAVIGLFDPTARVAGNEIAGRFAMRVSHDCDATQVILLFWAAVLSYPATWKHKALGMLAGTAAIVVVNVLRLCTLYYLGEVWQSAFEYAHEELWPLLLSAFVLVAFMVWAARRQTPDAEAPRAAP